MMCIYIYIYMDSMNYFIVPSVCMEGDPLDPGWILYCLCSYWIISHDQSKGLN